MTNPTTTALLANPFQFGVGHVWPKKVVNPGLVYDLYPQDYVSFLCALNYSQQETQFINGGLGDLSYPSEIIRLEDMNYPSFAADFQHSPSGVPNLTNLTRVLTDVGGKVQAKRMVVLLTRPESYRPLSTSLSPSVLSPNTLRFCKTNKKEKFIL